MLNHLSQTTFHLCSVICFSIPGKDIFRKRGIKKEKKKKPQPFFYLASSGNSWVIPIYWEGKKLNVDPLKDKIVHPSEKITYKF